MLRPHYPLETQGTYFTGGRVGLEASLDVTENLPRSPPISIWSPDRPTSSVAVPTTHVECEQNIETLSPFWILLQVIDGRDW